MAWIPLLPLALLRTLCLVIVAVLFVAADSAALVFSICSVEVHAALQYYCTAVFARVALYLLGFTALPSDPPFTQRTSSQKVVSTPVRPGELVVCNWSSYVDIIYLGYLYNPLFILPVVKDGAASPGSDLLIRGFERKTVLEMVFRTGHPPSQSPTTPVKSLAECLKESRRLRRPLVVFPEGTTSNNRALLRCPKLDEKSVGTHNGNVKVFCLAIKHEPPTALKTSITVPIPSWPWNLPHMLHANTLPLMLPAIFPPRAILVRCPRTHSIELDSAPKLVLAFQLAFDLISQAAKLKLTSQISGAHKSGFLNYAKSRKS